MKKSDVMLRQQTLLSVQGFRN